jgi:thiocyanate desulfurase
MSKPLDRRSFIMGAALGLGGAVLGRQLFSGGKLQAKLMADTSEAIDVGVELINAGKISQSFRELGKYIYLTPEKLGGGTHAVDLSSGKTLASISYWNYGDTCPISHHLAAYPSPDPYKGFEFVNSTQGGDNVMIYGLPTLINQRGILDRYGQGNHIYRVFYDGQQMNLIEDVAESTGIGLGVHTCIYPDATGFACADGQKDIAAFFDRPDLTQKTKVLMAFRADWVGKQNTGSLEANWAEGGVVRLVRLTQPKETGRFQLEGTQGNKIDWEMVPMAENLVYTGRLPGDSPRTLTGLDAVVHHPGNRYSTLILRMCSAAVVLDRQSWEPIVCLHNPEGSPGSIPIEKVSSDPDTWEIKFDDLKCVGHEAGFSPDGKTFAMMNNIKQNNMAVYDTSDADPRNWKKVTYVKDPTWVGDYPSPFHLAFSVDGSKMFVSVLYPKPGNSGSCVVDTKTWKIIKKFQNIGPDCQTMAVTYDGKYVLQIFSGFQRLTTGLFIYTQDTLEPVGFLPNFGGHHDCVVVPTKLENLRNSRCTTL